MSFNYTHLKDEASTLINDSDVWNSTSLQYTFLEYPPSYYFSGIGTTAFWAFQEKIDLTQVQVFLDQQRYAVR